MRRDFERDIIPMARHFGLALAPWDAIGSGKLQSKKMVIFALVPLIERMADLPDDSLRSAKRTTKACVASSVVESRLRKRQSTLKCSTVSLKSTASNRSPRSPLLVSADDKWAAQHSANLYTQSDLMQKTPYVFPIVG